MLALGHFKEKNKMHFLLNAFFRHSSPYPAPLLLNENQLKMQQHVCRKPQQRMWFGVLCSHLLVSVFSQINLL